MDLFDNLYKVEKVFHVTQESYDKLREENAKLKQDLKDALDCLSIQKAASAKRAECPLCKMNDASLRSTN